MEKAVKTFSCKNCFIQMKNVFRVTCCKKNLHIMQCSKCWMAEVRHKYLAGRAFHLHIGIICHQRHK